MRTWGLSADSTPIVDLSTIRLLYDSRILVKPYVREWLSDAVRNFVEEQEIPIRYTREGRGDGNEEYPPLALRQQYFEYLQ